MQTFPSNPDLQPYGFKNVENYHIYVRCYPTHTFATIALWQNYQNYKPYTPCIHIEQYCQVQVITMSKVSHSKSCISTIYVYFFWFLGTIWSKNLTPHLPPFEPLLDFIYWYNTLHFFKKMLAIRSMTYTYLMLFLHFLYMSFACFIFKKGLFSLCRPIKGLLSGPL